MSSGWSRVPEHPESTVQIPSSKSSKGSTKTTKTNKSSKTTSKNSSKSTESLVKKRDASQEAKKPLPTNPDGENTTHVPESNYSSDPRFFAGQLPYGNKKASIGSTPFLVRTNYLGTKTAEYESVGAGEDARRRTRLCSVMGILFLLGNGFFVILPLLFLVLVGLAWRLDGQRVADNEFGRRVYDSVRLAVTIFPFAFAAVAGRTMKISARFALERGAKLSTVETLLGSQTLWQTLKSQVMLRTLTLFSMPLILLWTLSPIGSQGSLRMLEKTLANSTVGTGSVLVLPTGGMSESQTNSSTFFPGSSLDQRNSYLAVDSLYAAALLNPRKGIPLDLWGNIKVPWVDLSAAGDDWVSPNATNATDIDSYTSLVGIPVANIPTQGGSNFTFDSAHFTLNCPTIFNASYDKPFWKDNLGQVWSGSKDHPDDLFFNSSTVSQSNFFLDTRSAFSGLGYLYHNKSKLGGLDPNAAPQIGRDILFGSRIPQPGSQAASIVIRNCTIQLEYVESLVGCVSGECKVEKVRKSPRYADFNTFATPLDSRDIALGVMKGLPFATGAATYSGETPSGLFLRGSTTPIVIPRLGLDSNPNTNLPNALLLDPLIFAKRLAILFNTYYQISIAPAAFLGNLPTLDSKLYGTCTATGQQCTSPDSDSPFFAIPAYLNNLAPAEVYTTDTTWLGLTAAAAALLFVTAVIGILLHNRTHVPNDLLGYASTLVMDSGDLNLPPGTAPLDGARRARWLGDVNIKINDPRIANLLPQRYGFGRNDVVEYPYVPR